MKLSGSLTAEDISSAYRASEEALKDHDRISIFVEVQPSMQFTIEGLIKDLTEFPGQICKLKKYYRAALVTDKGWMAALARVEGLVFSNIDVRVFGTSDREKAFAWAAATPEPLPVPEEPEPSIHFIQTTSENVLAYEVNGRLRERDIKRAVAEVKPYLDREGKFSVLARLKDFHGFDLLSVFDDELIRVKIKAPSKIDKYAVIGAKPWLRNLIELFDPVMRTQIRTFDPSEEDAAWEWIGARQALLGE